MLQTMAHTVFLKRTDSKRFQLCGPEGVGPTAQLRPGRERIATDDASTGGCGHVPIKLYR